MSSRAVRMRSDTIGWRTQLERVLAARYWILGTLAAAFGVMAGGRGDWNVFVSAGQAMVGSDGLHVFEHHGDIQTGPLSLLIAWASSFTPRNGFPLAAICCAVLGLVTVRSLERAHLHDHPEDPDASALNVLVGGSVVVVWWAQLGGYGHLDDAIVLAAVALSLLQVRQRRPLVAAMLIGLSIGVKPWAIIFLPLTWGRSGRLHSRLRPPLVALAVGAATWLPFVLGARTLRSLHTSVNVAADSVIGLFGATDANVPGWLRTAQLSGALVIAGVAMWRRGPVGALWVALAFRLATDPGTWSYYTVGFVVGALAWDLRSEARRAPVATCVSGVLLLPSWLVPWPHLRAIERLVVCAAAIVIVFCGARDDLGSADQLDPEPVRIPARIDR